MWILFFRFSPAFLPKSFYPLDLSKLYVVGVPALYADEIIGAVTCWHCGKQEEKDAPSPKFDEQARIADAVSSNTVNHPPQEVRYAVMPLTVGSKTFHYLFTPKVLHGMMSPSCSIAFRWFHCFPSHCFPLPVFPIAFP
ncbi:MAG: hypothetical protein ABS69_15650 [Nitrosomonadales bacterium SCN 54-20]|nr:MAG: hypothetical protein ABS69_15650 [Nitrosomonadales bacterium SCN 54-20]